MSNRVGNECIFPDWTRGLCGFLSPSWFCGLVLFHLLFPGVLAVLAAGVHCHFSLGAGV